MNASTYYIESTEYGFSICCGGTSLVTLSSIGQAISVMRSFQNKAFPRQWQKIPPAMRRAKEKLYQ